MPRNRPAMSGYERLASADQFSDSDSDTNDATISLPSSSSRPPAFLPRDQAMGVGSSSLHSHRNASANAQANSGRSNSSSYRNHGRHHRRTQSGVDIKAINARLERWADEFASKFKSRKGKNKAVEEERYEIHHSVFQAPEGTRPVTLEEVAHPATKPAMSKSEFLEVVNSVRIAISQGVHPRMISQGSSGSYFARNPEGKVVGVFKPKDEEPYAAGNPKWNKWIHRNLFPCFFGRACEAAAYTLDCQLQTYMVPYTDVVNLSSKSFHYPFWDRRRFYRNKKPLPEKPGSFQVFLKGFQDANIFLRQHPWPDQYLSGVRTNEARSSRRRRRRGPRNWVENCTPRGSVIDEEDEDEGDEEGATCSDDESARDPASASHGGSEGPPTFRWTEDLKQSFREELEKLVILDYIMRNTDRGLDNWMIRVDYESQQVSIASEPIQLGLNRRNSGDAGDGEEEDDTRVPRFVHSSPKGKSDQTSVSVPSAYQKQEPMASSSTSASKTSPKITLGAIDNSLSWPWKHPDAWRSFPFGWLFLPVDLIGRPFSEKTRKHFLPLLTSPYWWSQTQYALRKVFQMDVDFEESMFAKQMAVMKGQAWNVVETLKTSDHGPLELTRRSKVCVWDDLVDVPVAMPLRVASSEMRRGLGGSSRRKKLSAKAKSASARDLDVDEMDIGLSSGPSTQLDHSDTDIMGSSLPSHHPTNTSSKLPNPGRFDLTSSPPTPNERPASMSRSVMIPKPRSYPSSSDSHHDHPLASSTASFPPPRHQSRRASRSSSIVQQLYADAVFDDEEVDLGYAAAEGMERHRRKVIMERLETVKARNPVFSCW